MALLCKIGNLPLELIPAGSRLHLYNKAIEKERGGRMLILIEGVDGSGKETQARLLSEYLGVEKQSFPRYGEPAAAVAEAYLHGEVKMDAYSASLAFALDRVDWANKWRESGEPTVVLDRFAFSNFAYQGAKFESREDALGYIEWAKALEYGKLGVPIPDKTIYLIWEKDAWHDLLAQRGGSKHAGKDIHESNLGYLDRVYDFGVDLARREGAIIIYCDGLSREEIHEKIVAEIEKKPEAKKPQTTRNGLAKCKTCSYKELPQSVFPCRKCLQEALVCAPYTCRDCRAGAFGCVKRGKSNRRLEPCEAFELD